MDTTKKTIILFSGDFDKAMAALIIANGAAAMGDDVTIFCTFWGLNLLRKTNKVKTRGKKLPAGHVRQDDASRPRPSRPLEDELLRPRRPSHEDGHEGRPMPCRSSS